MKRFLILFSVVFLFLPLLAQDRFVGAGNSYSEFSYIVMVGQAVEVTPFSVVLENTAYETRANNDKIKRLVAYFNRDTDFRSHGMANALRITTVKDGKMRISFYLDNILKVFDDDVNTYGRYLPLYYLFLNNVSEFKLPESAVESLKKLSLDYYLTIPMVQKLMQDSWFAAVFMINPSSGRLTFKTGRFFETLEELNLSEWAQGYRIQDIIRSGMAVSMTKAIYVGHESEEAKENSDESDGKGKKQNGKQNRKQFDNRKSTPVGTER